MAKKKLNIDVSLESDMQAVDRLIAQAASGEDVLSDFLNSTSDRTISVQEIVAERSGKNDAQQSNSATDPAFDDPSLYGDPTDTPADFVRNVNAGLKSGLTLEDAANRVGQGLGNEQGQQGEGTAPAPDPETQDMAAQEIIEWYDMIQGVASVWLYDYVNSPKGAVQAVEALEEKVMAGNATEQEKRAFTVAFNRIKGYSGRKESFAETVAMNASIKERSARLLAKIMEIRGITISPEMLLALLLLTPVIVNGGRILIEKFGFEGGNDLIDQYTKFVNTQEKTFWKN